MTNLNTKPQTLLALLMVMALPSFSQLTYLPAEEDPFSTVTISHFASPALGDIDGDGDLDLFIGQYNSNDMLFYRNVGDVTSAVFEQQTGDQNPLEVYWNNSGCNAPVLVDIDADGDLDVFSGVCVNIIRYFRNDGDAMVPEFIYQGGHDNPLDTVFTEDVCSYPAFVDIDGDQDYDAFVTDGAGNIEFYRNTGDKFMPMFERDPAGNLLAECRVDGEGKDYISRCQQGQSA